MFHVEHNRQRLGISAQWLNIVCITCVLPVYGQSVARNSGSGHRVSGHGPREPCKQMIYWAFLLSFRS
jgi:hypothetical protein